MEEQFDITQDWDDIKATCTACNRIVESKVDPTRIDKFFTLVDDSSYWGGPFHCAIEVWTESPHWYRELILVATAATRVQDYYCDTCFNHNYPKGIIETADQLRNHMRCKLFMEEQGDNASWDFTTLDESTRLWRKQIWDDVTARVFSNK